jgi:dTDP-L-rhamnose 4-epimerase
LVTGGAGFVGSHVVDALVRAGHEVRVIDRGQPDASSDFQFVHGDLRDAEVVRGALRGVEAICHQAAMVGPGANLDEAAEYVGANDVATAVLLAESARAGISRWVLASSVVVYGAGYYRCAEHGLMPAPARDIADLDAGRFEPRCPTCGAEVEPELLGEDTPCAPSNVFAATKVAQEHLAGAAARFAGLQVAVLRYHHVYGSRTARDSAYAGPATAFRSALAEGRAPEVFEDGGQYRDFVHVRDVARANLAALAATAVHGPIAPGTLRVYNIGSGAPRTVGELASALSEACGGPAPRITGAYRSGDIRHLLADSARAAAELGWTATEDFAAGMAEFTASGELTRR